MNIIIREAMNDDKQQIAEVFAFENRLHSELQPEIFATVEPSDILGESWFEDVLTSESSSIFVAEAEGLIVGLIYYSIILMDNPIYQINGLIRVQEMVVVEEYKGRGVGRSLMDHVEQVARKSGIYHITLQVWENNVKAIRFYEQLGFCPKEHLMWKSVR